jgi:hypothetical protein
MLPAALLWLVNHVKCRSTIFGLVTLLPAVCVTMGVANADQTIWFDLKYPREFQGFGVAMYPGATSFQAERDRLMSWLNISWVRLGRAGPAFRSADFVNSGMSVEHILGQLPNHPNAVAAGMTPPQLRAQQAIDATDLADYRALATELAGKKLHFVMKPPSNWLWQFDWRGSIVTQLMANQAVGSGATATTEPDHRTDYANYVTAVLLYARSNGLVPEAIEFISEPDAYYANLPPALYSQELHIIRATMDRYGFQAVGIEGPGTGNTYTAATGSPSFMTALQDEGGGAAELVRYSVHDYDTRTLPAPAGLASVFSDSISLSKPIYVTEFSNLEPRFMPGSSSFTYGPTSPSQFGSSRLNSVNRPSYGVSVAAEALKLIGDGAQAIALWQLDDLAWLNCMGLIDLEGHVRPAAHAIGTFFSHLPPDAKIVSYRSNGVRISGVAATAFSVTTAQRHGMIVAIANASVNGVSLPAAQKIHLRLAGSAWEPAARAFHAIASYPPQSIPVIESSAGLHLEVPPNTVVVLANFDPPTTGWRPGLF